MNLNPLPEVELIAPDESHRDEFLAHVAASRALHSPWVTAPGDADTFARYLQRISTPQHRGFLVVDKPSGDMIGVVNVNDIRLGVLCSASLGYYGFARRCGNGRMTAGVKLAVDASFGEIGLHRVEANIQPSNAPSRALAERLGLRLEGFSPRYLYISGDWRDHERWAVLKEDWPG